MDVVDLTQLNSRDGARHATASTGPSLYEVYFNAQHEISCMGSATQCIPQVLQSTVDFVGGPAGNSLTT